MKNNINDLKKDLKQLKFALSNTSDPINVVHLKGQIKTIENKIEKLKSKKEEPTEQTMAGSSGSFEAPAIGGIVKRKINHIPNMNEIKGGLSDKKTLLQIVQKHAYDDSKDSVTPEKIEKMKMFLQKELQNGIKIEMEHTNDQKIAREIAMDHLMEDPKYYQKLKKIETKGEFKEATDASSSGSYDVPLFGSTPKGRRDPLKIDGPKSIGKSRAVKDKNFPKWGGPQSVFIKIKDKCKKFPYCNQGDINAIEPLREAIENASKKYGLPISEVENIVLNEIKQIFI